MLEPKPVKQEKPGHTISHGGRSFFIPDERYLPPKRAVIEYSCGIDQDIDDKMRPTTFDMSTRVPRDLRQGEGLFSRGLDNFVPNPNYDPDWEPPAWPSYCPGSLGDHCFNIHGKDPWRSSKTEQCPYLSFHHVPGQYLEVMNHFIKLDHHDVCYEEDDVRDDYSSIKGMFDHLLKERCMDYTGGELEDKAGFGAVVKPISPVYDLDDEEEEEQVRETSAPGSTTTPENLELQICPSEMLWTPGDNIETFDDNFRACVERMKEICRENGGAGIAAQQVGWPVKVFVVRVPHEGGAKEHVYVNAMVTPFSGQKYPSTEGCLSFPGMEKTILRYPRVRVKFKNEHGQKKTEVVKDWFKSRCVQHEYDHTRGRPCITEEEYAEFLEKAEREGSTTPSPGDSEQEVRD